MDKIKIATPAGPMEIIVTTPVGTLTVSHQGRTATASGPPAAVATWTDALFDGLYGHYGHIFDATNCFVSDLVATLVSVYGSDSVAMAPAVAEACREEVESVPDDAVT